MNTKLFEVRDRETFVPVMATAMNPLATEEIISFAEQFGLERERYLLRRAGYGGGRPQGGLPGDVYVKLSQLDKGWSTYNAFDWRTGDDGCPRSQRTMHVAHRYIIEHWQELTSGDVIDVEYILGETTAPKKSEQLTQGQLL